MKTLTVHRPAMLLARSVCRLPRSDRCSAPGSDRSFHLRKDESRATCVSPFYVNRWWTGGRRGKTRPVMMFQEGVNARTVHPCATQPHTTSSLCHGATHDKSSTRQDERETGTRETSYGQDECFACWKSTSSSGQGPRKGCCRHRQEKAEEEGPASTPAIKEFKLFRWLCRYERLTVFLQFSRRYVHELFMVRLGLSR